MDWIEKQINDDAVFPSQVGVPFPRNFLQVCKKILTRLYRVFVHVYIHHFEKLVSKGEEAETGIFTCYKHFYFFVIEFKLVDPKEFEPLVCHYIDYLVSSPDCHTPIGERSSGTVASNSWSKCHTCIVQC